MLLYLIPLIILIVANIYIVVYMKRNKEPILLGWAIVAFLSMIAPGFNVIAVLAYIIILLDVYSAQLTKFFNKEIL